MLQLCSVATLDVAERRIGGDDTRRDQIFERNEVFLLAYAVEVSTAERKGAKMSVDIGQQ